MDTIATRIGYNRELNEYTVRLYVNGVRQQGADYYTDDKEDAEGTALAMVEHLKAHGVAPYNGQGDGT